MWLAKLTYVMPASPSSQGNTGVLFTLPNTCTLSIVRDSRKQTRRFSASVLLIGVKGARKYELRKKAPGRKYVFSWWCISNRKILLTCHSNWKDSASTHHLTTIVSNGNISPKYERNAHRTSMRNGHTHPRKNPKKHRNLVTIFMFDCSS